MVRIAALVLLGALVATPASAYHTDKVRITDDTAYTLRDGEIRLGVWKFEYGLLDDLDIGSYTIPWFLKIVSITGKYEAWSNADWAFAGKVGFVSLDFQRLAEDSPPGTRLSVVPLSALASYRLGEDWGLSAEIVHTKITFTGETGDDGSTSLAGAAALTNTQFTTTLAWRLSDVTALILHYRKLLHQEASAAAGTEQDLDKWTRIEFFAAGSTDELNFEGAQSIAPGVLWSWENVNLRLGFALGNINIPVVNFVAQTSSFFPDFDLYIRW
jgi:hypothetical protein